MKWFLALLCFCSIAQAQFGLRSPAYVAQLQRTPAAGGGGDLSYTNGLLVWLEADNLSLSDNDPVVTWTASGYTAVSPTNLTAANRPVYKANIVNGKPVVRFDGTDDFLLWDVNPIGDAGTIFAVVGNVTETAANAVAGNVGPQRIVTFFPDATTVYGGDGSEIFGNAFSTRVNGAATSTFPGSGAFGYITQRKNSGTASLGTLRIGESQLNDDWNGDLAALLIFDSILSDTDRDTVEAYLAAKYGL